MVEYLSIPSHLSLMGITYNAVELKVSKHIF